MFMSKAFISMLALCFKSGSLIVQFFQGPLLSHQPLSFYSLSFHSITSWTLLAFHTISRPLLTCPMFLASTSFLFSFKIRFSWFFQIYFPVSKPLQTVTKCNFFNVIHWVRCPETCWELRQCHGKKCLLVVTYEEVCLNKVHLHNKDLLRMLLSECKL